MSSLSYVKPVQFHVGMARLEKLAALLERADAQHKRRGEPTYSQLDYRHECGTPACALGHYTMISNGRFTISVDYPGVAVNWGIGHYGSVMDAVATEFAISWEEAREIFSGAGCDVAGSAKDASRYIKNFVKRKRLERSKIST